MILDGKKTYITAGILALASFATAVGWLNKQQYEVIAGLVGSLGLAALRVGMVNCDIKKTDSCSGESAPGPDPAAEPATASESKSAAIPAAVGGFENTATAPAPAATSLVTASARPTATAPDEASQPPSAAVTAPVAAPPALPVKGEPVTPPPAAVAPPLTQDQYAVLIGLLKTLGADTLNTGKPNQAGTSPAPSPSKSPAALTVLEAEAMPI